MVNIIKNKFKIIIFTLAVILLVLVFLNSKFRSENKKSEYATVKTGRIEQKLIISGEIEAEEKVTLKFQTSGKLTWVGVKEGDYVKKYQGIAALDQREVEKNLKKKLLSYMNQRWDFEEAQDDKSVRGRYIYQVPGLTDAERRVLDKAQFDLDSSVLDVEIAALAKEYSFLATPIEGIVTNISAPFSGVNVTPAGAEFEIINPNSVYFMATADQTEVIQLSQGITGQLRLDSYPDSSISGFIKNISFKPKESESSTVYEIKFDFSNENSSNRYRIGMAGDLTFVTKSKENALYVPAKFVKSQDGKKYLKTLKNGKQAMVFITTGMETENEIEVASGAVPGETIYD